MTTQQQPYRLLVYFHDHDDALLVRTMAKDAGLSLTAYVTKAAVERARMEQSLLLAHPRTTQDVDADATD